MASDIVRVRVPDLLGSDRSQVLEDRVAAGTGLRARTPPPRRTASSVSPMSSGSDRQPVPAQARRRSGRASRGVPAQEDAEGRAEAGQLAVGGGAGEQQVDGVHDLVAAAAGRAAGAADRHRHAADRTSASASTVRKSSSVDVAGVAQHRLGAAVRAMRGGQAVDRLAASRRASSQSAMRRQVADHVADAGPDAARPGASRTKSRSTTTAIGMGTP